MTSVLYSVSLINLLEFRISNEVQIFAVRPASIFRCGRSPLLDMKGAKMIKGDHAPNFPLRHAEKARSLFSCSNSNFLI